VRVHAVNAAGAGASSLLVTVTPRATPGVPTGLTATSGNASAQLSFVAPTSDGGSAVTGYDVSTDGGTTWSSLTASGTSTLTATVTGLTNGTQYSVQVRAKNAAGAGAATSGVQVTPLTVPGAPTSFSAIGGDGQLVLHFVAPAADGGTPITTYEASTDSGATWSAVTVSGTGTLTATVTGLTNGTQYLVRVHAVNAVGSGASSLLIQATPMTTPSVPGSFTAVRGNGSAALSFTAPSADGGSPVTGYQYSTDAGGTWSALTTSGTSPITATITGLTNGTQYDVQVRAVSAAGNGTATSSAQVTPRTVPGAPSSFSAIPGDGQITVQFTAPASDGGSSITGYDASTDGGATWSAVAVSGSGPLTATVTGLTNGTEYLVKVRATNLAGSGTTSLLVQVTPRTTPAAPSSISATPGNGSASLSFPAPSDGGATITGYQVSTDNGATWSSVGFTGSTTITVTVSGLTNGTQYDLALRASNAAGTGPASVAAQVTPRTVPAAPASLTLAPGNQQLGLQFTAPTDNGGAAISGYEVSTDSGATWTTLATTGTGTLAGTVTGLTNGTQYGVLVRAVNVAGSGSGSGLVPATPRTVPNAPTSLSLTPGNTQLALQFTVPSDNGGAAITGYEVSTDSGTTWASLLHSGTGPITAVLTGLGNGTQYGVEVRAVNLAGSGAASLVAQATPRTVPGAPGSVTLVPSSHQFALHFAAPSSDGGAAIGGYEVSSDGGTTWSPLTVSGSGTINGMVTGLVNGTQYSVRVRAVNVAGSGAASALVTVTPRDIPGPPSDLAATPQNGGGSLSFSAPSDNGGATITGYQVSSDNGATWSPLDTVGSAAISATVPGLKNGIQYSVSVRAVNDAGAGPQSVAADVTPRTVAVAPAGLVAVPGAGQLGLQFAAPIDDGGAAITGYEASTDGGATWSELTVSGSVPITAGLSGLQNSTRYRIAVRAVNVAGEGAASRVVTAATLPAALNAPQVRPGVASAELRWAPSSASYVTGYTVSAHPGPATCTTVGHDATSCVIGATSGTAYTYTVIAHSPFGDSAVSASSVAAVAKAPVRPGQAPASGAYRLGTTTGFISTLRPRQRITVLGSDLLPFGSVAILIYSQPRVLGSTTADANGNFRITVTIPADLETGKHTIVASSVDRDGTVRLLTLHGNYDPQVARPPMSGSSAGAQSLAFTGTPTFQLVAIGVVTMCAGVVMLQFGRGRARATSR
jgi:titin